MAFRRPYYQSVSLVKNAPMDKSIFIIVKNVDSELLQKILIIHLSIFHALFMKKKYNQQ